MEQALHPTTRFLLNEPHIFNEKPMRTHDPYLWICRELGVRRKDVQSGPCLCGPVHQFLSSPIVSNIYGRVVRPHTITIAIIRAVYAP